MILLSKSNNRNKTLAAFGFKNIDKIDPDYAKLIGTLQN